MAGYKFDDEKHTYVLVKSNSVDVAIRNIANLQLKSLVIENDSDYKALYESRAQINKFAKEVTDMRKQMVMAVTGQFQSECKTIEKACADATHEMTERLNAYKPKTRERKYFKLTINVDNISALNKIRKFALKYNAEITEEK